MSLKYAIHHGVEIELNISPNLNEKHRYTQSWNGLRVTLGLGFGLGPGSELTKLIR